MEKKAIVPIEIEDTAQPAIQQAMSMPQVIQYAIQSNAGADKLEKMMALQERYEANEARKAYHVAMAAFKSDPPEINKDAHVNYKSQKTGQVTDYKHATLANVTTTINKGLSKHGLSAAWIQDQTDKGISVTCKITHIQGHSESTTLIAAPDTSGGKNTIQAIGSTVTYLQRYTILSLTGLATEEIDDDGQGSEAKYITEDQVAEINKGLVKKDVDLSSFLTYMVAESLDKIKETDFKKAMNAIKLAKGKSK